MAKLADAADLKSADQKWLWGFKSPSRHQENKAVIVKQAARKWVAVFIVVAILVAIW